MAASQDLERENVERAEPRQEADEVFRNGGTTAWEPTEHDLWIPYRVRGSWRGGILG